jgi:hypothetical protein
MCSAPMLFFSLHSTVVGLDPFVDFIHFGRLLLRTPCEAAHRSVPCRRDELRGGCGMLQKQSDVCRIGWPLQRCSNFTSSLDSPTHSPCPYCLLLLPLVLSFRIARLARLVCSVHSSLFVHLLRACRCWPVAEFHRKLVMAPSRHMSTIFAMGVAVAGATTQADFLRRVADGKVPKSDLEVVLAQTEEGISWATVRGPGRGRTHSSRHDP